MATSGESPMLARRRVRLALREARERAGLTQGQVAEAMEWSLSKVMRIESGEVSISTNDLRPLLAHLGVTGRSRVDALVQDARTSRQRHWSDEQPFREHLTPAMRQLMQYEAEATAIRSFTIMVLPGPLQIPSYATATLNAYRGDLPDEDIQARVDARIRRRQDLLARQVKPETLLLLDESVIQRRIGGAQTMREQLHDLLDLVDRLGLRIRVFPFAIDAIDAPLPTVGSYDIVNLGPDDAVLYRESQLQDELVEDTTKVARHRGMFDQLWDAALPESTSLRLIDKHARSTSPGGRRRSSAN